MDTTFRATLWSFAVVLIACSPGSGSGSAAGENGTEPSSDAGMLMDADLSEDGGTAQDGDICAGETVEAERTPLDILIMLDQSSSMQSQSKWDNVTSAIHSFVNAPEAGGIFVALSYFAKTKACVQNSDCQSWLGSCGQDGFCTFDDYCAAADYVTPEVDFSELPMAATAIDASLAQHSPLYNTPTPPALEGALEGARLRATAHPDHAVVVVLATDGMPDSVTCNIDSGSLGQVVTAAQSGLAGTPSIPTYVIGVGNQLTDLNNVAAAGGTGTAFIVQSNGTTEQEFLDAMNQIRGDAVLPCEYLIPPPDNGPIDFGKVNVLFTPDGATEPETIYQVPGEADCGDEGGWYYDDPQAPTRILLCPATCADLASGGRVDIELGCATQVLR